MRKIFKLTAILGLMGLTLTQFTNCDVYSENGLFTQYSVSCAGAECGSTDGRVDFIKIKANYSDPFVVLATAQFINVAGECNEGGFEDSVVVWRLYDGQTLKATSDEDPTFAGSCVNGRFTLKVRIRHNYGSATAADWYDGLQVPPRASNLFRSHLLEIEIFGRDEAGNLIRNPSLAPESIWLVPISFTL